MEKPRFFKTILTLFLPYVKSSNLVLGKTTEYGGTIQREEVEMSVGCWYLKVEVSCMYNMFGPEMFLASQDAQEVMLVTESVSQ